MARAEATMAISAATDVVSYFLYLDLLGELVTAKTDTYDLGEETDRVQRPLISLPPEECGPGVKRGCRHLCHGEPRV